jgi:hypothetical protein
MIYPTPTNCLPKKTTKGLTSVNIKGLETNTPYTAMYKVDNTIACITTPCHENGLQSASKEFTSTSSSTNFSRNLYYRSRGADVVLLQDILRAQGYFSYKSTGYFGIATFKAVKAFIDSCIIIYTVVLKLIAFSVAMSSIFLRKNFIAFPSMC